MNERLMLDTQTTLADAEGRVHQRLVPFESWAKDGCRCGWRSETPNWRSHANTILDASLALLEQVDPQVLLIKQWRTATARDLSNPSAIKRIIDQAGDP